MKVWQFLSEKLNQGQKAALLYVVANEGSSPGRKGFAMAVAEDGDFCGTIGGGIMEVKLLELAKQQLTSASTKVLIKKQYHDKNHAPDQSGLICSGMQTVAIIPLSEKERETVHTTLKQQAEGVEVTIVLQKDSIQLGAEISGTERGNISEDAFPFTIQLPAPKRVHIFGGGHVGLALSQVLSLLNYQIIIYDDRPELNTLSQNKFAHDIRLINYKELDNIKDLYANDTVILLTFSYRSDYLLLKQLYDKSFAFIGVMGSDAKIKKLLEDMQGEGITAKALEHIHAPIGLPIFSKTAMEIAVSIAAELIFFNNKDLPTGRSAARR